VGRERNNRLLLVCLVWLLASQIACQNPAATSNGAPAANAMAATSRTASSNRLLSGPSRDLSQDERAGDHILRKHVGLSEEDLRERLSREPDISGASTYTDRQTAEHAVGAAIANSEDRIERWLSRPGRHPNLVLDYNGDEPIGRTMNRGAVHSEPCTHALVVLKYAGPNNYYVLTSYPECRS
jgi:hypothetical protein